MPTEQTYLLALSHLYRNRLRKIHALLHAHTSAEEAWHTLREEGMRDALDKALHEEEFIARHSIQVLSINSPDYPYRLRECPDAPVVLYSKGNVRPNTGKMISVVGTRDCSDRGKQTTRQLVMDLAQLLPDITIVSGLAYGVDIAAHRAAIEADIPTIIVTGHGMDRIYPAYHRKEAVQSLAKGGILTEYMSGTEPERQNFVARDRIIAGLADAVVVVESKARGGALITAHMAIDYARSLFAFPGRISDNLSEGCNNLIRDQKAGLITSAEDLIKAMMWETAPSSSPVQTEMVELFDSLSPEETILLNTLREQEDGIHINMLVIETQLPYNQVASTLTMMEMKELVKSLPGGIYRALK